MKFLLGNYLDLSKSLILHRLIREQSSMKPIEYMPKNSKNQVKFPLFVFPMTNFVNRWTDNKQKHPTLQPKNGENLGPTGKPVPTRRGGVCLRRNALCRQVLQRPGKVFCLGAKILSRRISKQIIFSRFTITCIASILFAIRENG